MPLQGSLYLPGDKSISHRAIMFSALAQGQSTIQNLSNGADVRSTIQCFQQLGVSIQQVAENTWQVNGENALKTPTDVLDCGNSGTTIRLLSGILAGAGIQATLTGDASLQKRPMKRVLEPLTQMGLNIASQPQNGCAPLTIHPAMHGVQATCYTLPMASAQVKSAVLLAGLFAPPQNTIEVIEPLASRDHTERMLNAMGCAVQKNGEVIRLVGRVNDLKACNYRVPGDISSAAFWMVGCAITPGSHITLRHVSMNPGRTGLLNLLQRLGADIELSPQPDACGEPVADITMRYAPLQGDIVISPQEVPALIDEIPILTILGLFQDGHFILQGAEELRHKESDRLEALIVLLQTLGVTVHSYPDGMRFTGNPNWHVPTITTALETHHDHRLVMALEILNLRASAPLPITGQEWVGISYPGFYDTLRVLQHATSIA